MSDFPFEVAFDVAPVALLCVDAEGRLRGANGSARTVLGITDDGIEGPWGAPSTLDRLFPGAEAARLRTLCGQALLHRRTEQAEIGASRAGGRSTRLAVEASPAVAAGFVVLAVRDLHVDAQDGRPGTGAVREGLDRYRRLFAANRDAVLVLDATSHVIVEANHAAVQLAGRPDLVGIPSTDLVSPGHRSTWTMAVTGAGASSSIAPDLEIELLREDGTSRSTAVQLDGLVLGDGRVVVANLRAQPTKKRDQPARTRRVSGTETTKPVVLVVDDDDGARRAAGRLLGRLGFETIEASSGEDAVDLVDERGAELALVLLDVVMPGVDGLTAYARIKRAHDELPVILCSGYDELDRLEGVSLASNTRFLPKPFDLEAVRERVRALFGPDPEATALG